MEASDFSVTRERFTGFGAQYDEVRPSAPAALAELLLPMAGCTAGRAGLVVDLGSGTGLSTRYWAPYADRVIGVEPTASMRQEAERRTLPPPGEGEENGKAAVGIVSCRDGYSHDTGLDGGSADLVVCAQSLHWMEPEGTFAEAARILRPGGVFAAYDYDWPPVTPFPEVDALYEQCCEESRRLEKAHGVSAGLRQWDKEGHLGRMTASGRFRFVRECLLHHREPGGADRIAGLLLSQGHVRTLLKRGFSEADVGLDPLRETARRAFSGTVPLWFWSVRVRIGVVPGN